MENNFFKDLINKSAEFKNMQTELNKGNAPDIGGVIDFITKLPNELDTVLDGMSATEKKKLEPMLKELKEKSSLTNILNSIKAETEK